MDEQSTGGTQTETPKEGLNFSTALILLKKGSKVARKGWRNTDIIARVQFPDENSMNTLPYIVMEKGDSVFPLDLSCESLFAEDWYIVQ